MVSIDHWLLLFTKVKFSEITNLDIKIISNYNSAFLLE